MRSTVVLYLFALGTPAWAVSTGPPVFRTGAPVDGGLNCTACHRTFAPANSDPRGRLAIQVDSYTPGVKQKVRVTVFHPEATRWGFQLTARPTADETKMAGTFTADASFRVRCAPAGADAPCNGALEFISHRQATTLLGSAGQATFEVEWTPPSEDVGPVVFYAAGNAADNSGANTGDRVYSSRAVALNTQGCAVTQRPVISGISNAASGASGIAYNSLFSIYGLNLFYPTRTKATAPADFEGDKFPKELWCVAVEVDGQRMPVTYVSGGQVNASGPSRVNDGPASVRVIVNPGRPNELRSDAFAVNFTTVSPAFYTWDGTSVAASAGNELIGPTAAGARAARPGEVVALYGTGWGATEPYYQAGEVTWDTARLREAYTLTIGGVTIQGSEIEYAGLSGNSMSSLYQINVRIPQSLPNGNLPVTLRIAGSSSQSAVVIPVAR